MTKPENRDASRRGNDNTDIGYGVAIGATPSRGKRWPAPNDIGGATCKAPRCIRCWVLGHEEPFTVAVERMEY